MSTDYRPADTIVFAHLFDGRLKRFGIREHLNEQSTDRARCLTDGNNYLWVCADEKGNLSSLTRWLSCGAPQKILWAIEEVFETEIYSEYEPQFWGFETQEEWDHFMDKLAREHADKFYADVIKFVRGEEHGLRPGTIGMLKAELAKALINEEPRLSDPDKKDELMAKIEELYEAEHTIWVKLTEEDEAFVKMLSTHEDDLPSA